MHQDPILVLGNIKIYYYGLMIALGILACFWVLFYYTKRLGFTNKETDFVFYNGIVAIAMGFFGAALWQSCFNYIEEIQQVGIENAKFVWGGLTVIGGIITGALSFIIGTLIFRKKHFYLLTRIVVIAPCCITVAHAFGRIGCFFAGCCYGKPATGAFAFLGVSFPKGSLYNTYDGSPVYPTQLFEAAYLFILFGVLSYLALKGKGKYNMPIYMLAYSIWRFLIEFVRGDDRGAFVGSLYPSQTQSLFLIAVAIGLFFLIKYLNDKMEKDKAALALAGGGELDEDETAENAETANVIAEEAKEQTVSGAGEEVKEEDEQTENKNAETSAEVKSGEEKGENKE